MEKLATDIARAAEKAVELYEGRYGDKLDYSEASLALVDRLLAEATSWVSDLTHFQFNELVENISAYILEVGRREFGGRYMWHEGQDQPVLVVGEPDCRIGVLTREKVRGRLGGDDGDQIPFFYAGFAERARDAKFGDDVLFV